MFAWKLCLAAESTMFINIFEIYCTQKDANYVPMLQFSLLTDSIERITFERSRNDL